LSLTVAKRFGLMTSWILFCKDLSMHLDGMSDIVALATSGCISQTVRIGCFIFVVIGQCIGMLYSGYSITLFV